MDGVRGKSGLIQPAGVVLPEQRDEPLEAWRQRLTSNQASHELGN